MQYRLFCRRRALIPRLDLKNPPCLFKNPSILTYLRPSPAKQYPIEVAGPGLLEQRIETTLPGSSQSLLIIYGRMLIGGPGGQPDSQLGALLSKGGRGITVLRSAVMGGTVSSIVAQFEPGSVVTVGRNYADYIVTEYGIAKLMNKNFRERANELIAVAHPDFREELRNEARRLFWP
jgi:acyl-CoA hydrolase